MSDPADLGVGEAVAALREGSLSSVELTEACLRRIAERDGTHSHDGDPASINAWIRVYEEDAIEGAKRADQGWKTFDKNQGKIYDLVMDMLSYSKDREPAIEEVDLNQIVRDVLELLGAAVEEPS